MLLGAHPYATAYLRLPIARSDIETYYIFDLRLESRRGNDWATLWDFPWDFACRTLPMYAVRSALPFWGLLKMVRNPMGMPFGV
ncbi:hypothetical protein CK218_21345 [Mesorhizobium sp. WSM3879]|nr:hypothetical protein CK218_21345 [Mesorhizobium sp. WSM3879]